MRLVHQSVLAACAIALTLPCTAEGQRRPAERRNVRLSFERERVADREITLSVGVLDNDDEDVRMPMAAVRVDWGLRRWLTSELGVSYATGSIEQLEDGMPIADERDLQLATATVGLRAELPTPYVRPYIGASGGLVLRDEEDGSSYVRTTAAFPAGLRLNLSNRISFRAEARFRFDRRRAGGEAVRIEQTGGLSVVF